jgi:hypothetical protein
MATTPITLEVNHTYLMRDRQPIKIGWTNGHLIPSYRIFRISKDHPDYWYRAGGHYSGNEALRLVIEAPSVPATPTPAPEAPALEERVKALEGRIARLEQLVQHVRDFLVI